MRVTRALRHRPFALLWSGQSVSGLGDGIYAVALAWFVVQKTGSATAMGLVLACAFAPMIVFLLIGGVAVDRFSRLHLMLGSDLLRGLIVLAVTVLAAANRLEIRHVLVASVLFGFVRAFFQPAYTAVVPDITPEDLLPSANSLTSISREIAGIGGPALGGMIVSLGGTPAAFGLDAVSFFVSAGCLLALTGIPELGRPVPRGQSALHDLRQGVGSVMASPWLWITVAVAALVNVTEAGPRNVVLPFLVKQALHGGAAMFGLLNSLFSAGIILGAILVGRRARLRRRGPIGYGAWMVAGLMALLLGLPIGAVGVGTALLLSGVALATFDLIWTNVLQEKVPRERLGRVSSIDALGSFALLPVGSGLAGIMSDRIGPSMVFVVGGALSAGIIGIASLHPAIRGLD